jgi:hypothetical protein
MSKSPSRRFPVTVTELPVIRCQICHRTVAYGPGSPSGILTEHYGRHCQQMPAYPLNAQVIYALGAASAERLANRKDSTLFPGGDRAVAGIHNNPIAN